jgi:hypothetical protein
LPQLAIDKDFMDDYSKLEKSVQAAVFQAFDKFAEHTHAGLHLEKLQHPKDDRVRTIRIDINWRGVVLAPESGDTYCLLKVLPHDKAYAYAASRKFTVNQVVGVMDVHDEAAREEIQPALEQAAAVTDERLFVHVSDADLTRLGIDDNTRTIARLLTSEAHLEAMATAGVPFSPSFLEREWRQVILAQGLNSEGAYMTCSRAGQGTPLGKVQRRQVWQVVRQVEATLQATGRDTFLQLADEAARVLRGAPVAPYQHVIIDEAQDLHPAQWRLLRAAVATGPDDMFIVGDPHQRIYGNTVSLARLAINVRGRSRRLTVNYRTTQEILAVAVRALGMGPIDGLDDEADTLEGYRSPRSGRRPRVIPARSREAELASLVKQVRTWLDDGIEAHAIGVAARSGTIHKGASAQLEAAGIQTVSLSAKSSPHAVRVGTMHGMKGLEFQAVAVIGVSDGIVPAPNAVTPEAEDPVAHAQDLQRERCLLFVACTRARDHLYVSYNGTPSPFLG